MTPQSMPHASPGLAEARRLYRRHDDPRALALELHVEHKRPTPRPDPPAIAGQLTLDDAAAMVEAEAQRQAGRRAVVDVRANLEQTRRLDVATTGRGKAANVFVACRQCGTRLAFGPAGDVDDVLELARRNANARPCCDAWLNHAARRSERRPR